MWQAHALAGDLSTGADAARPASTIL